MTLPPALVSRQVTQAEMDEPWAAACAKALGHRFVYSRNLWEHITIARAARHAFVGVENPRALGFGIGREHMPSYLAGLGACVVATDQHDAGSWAIHGEHANGQALHLPALVSAEDFHERVTFRAVDMRAIPDDLLGGEFDFVWSACAMEHLGSRKAGCEFVRAAMRVLRPGGIAVHTTELNVSSPRETLESPNLSLYTRADLLALGESLVGAGHQVAIHFDDGVLPWDTRVASSETALGTEHLKLGVAGYVTTSFALIVIAGA